MEEGKSKEKDLNYPLKLWILTLFIATILYSLWLAYNDVSDGGWSKVTVILFELIIVIFGLLGLGFIFALPTLIVIWSLYRGYILLTKSPLTDYIITVLLSIISVFASFKLLLGGFDFDMLAIVYIIAIPVAAVVLYVRQKRKQYKNIAVSLTTINTE